MSLERPSSSVTTAKKLCPLCGIEIVATELKCPRDDTVLLNPFAVDPQLKAKYEFLGTIGSGGMGVIYKAHQIAINKVVAIKMLHPASPSEEALQRFQREGKAVAMVAHQYIIGIHDFSVTESGRPYMVMDYVDGETLASLIANEGTLAPPRFRRIFTQVCTALGHAHKRGVLHRDIKPSNIMIVLNEDGDEEVRVMDFGVAKLISDTGFGALQLTKTGEALGSPIYMSPEQSRGQKVDARSDLYSLGCVMYESLAGHPPFIGATNIETLMMHVKHPPKELSDPDVDPHQKSIIMRLLEKDPDKRYQSMEDVITALHEFSSALRGKKKVSKPEPRKAAQSRAKEWLEHPLLWVGALVVVGGIAVGAMIWFNSGHVHKSQVNTEVTSYDAIQQTLHSTSIKEIITQRLKARPVNFDVHKFGTVFTFKKGDLEPLSTADYIRNLNLSKLDLTDDDIEPIASMQLSDLKLAADSVKDLHALKNMRSLGAIGLDNTDLDHEGYKTLSSLNLYAIVLADSGIEDKDLLVLSNMSTLTYLDIRGCRKLHSNAVEQFQLALPLCAVNWDGQSLNQPAYRLGKLEKRKDWPAMVKLLSKMLSDFEKKPGIRNQQMVQVYLRLANAQKELGQQKESDQSNAKAAALSAVCSTDPVGLAYAKHCVSGTVDQRIKDSIKYRQQAQQDFEKHIPKDTESRKTWLSDYASNTTALSTEQETMHDRTGGLQTFSKAIAFLHSKGMDGLDLAHLEHGQGDMLLRGREFAKAEQLYSSAEGKYDKFKEPNRGLAEGITFTRSLALFNLKKFAAVEDEIEPRLARDPANNEVRMQLFAVLIKALRAQKKDDLAAAYQKEADRFKEKSTRSKAKVIF